jgi:GNAT superfamily N-acetyltransferase
MSPLHIRKAAVTDAAAISLLLGQLGYATAEAEVPLRIDRLLASRGLVLVATRESHVVGLATAHLLSVINRPRDVAWLTALVVDSSARRFGVGRALVGAVEEFACSHGCEWLSVTTHEARIEAQNFYLGLGMELTGRRFGKALHP